MTADPQARKVQLLEPEYTEPEYKEYKAGECSYFGLTSRAAQAPLFAVI